MSGISIELELNEEGYRRLAGITEAMARKLPAFNLGDALHLVIETGTAAIEERLRIGASGIVFPPPAR